MTFRVDHALELTWCLHASTKITRMTRTRKDETLTSVESIARAIEGIKGMDSGWKLALIGRSVGFILNLKSFARTLFFSLPLGARAGDGDAEERVINYAPPSVGRR